MVGLRVPERDRNKSERVTGPQPERVRSIFAGVNAKRRVERDRSGTGTGPERDRNGTGTGSERDRNGTGTRTGIGVNTA